MRSQAGIPITICIATEITLTWNSRKEWIRWYRPMIVKEAKVTRWNTLKNDYIEVIILASQWNERNMKKENRLLKVVVKIIISRGTGVSYIFLPYFPSEFPPHKLIFIVVNKLLGIYQLFPHFLQMLQILQLFIAFHYHWLSIHLQNLYVLLSFSK